MHGERRGIARLRLANVHEQRGAKPFTSCAVTMSVACGAAADPLPQMIEIGLFVHDDLSGQEGLGGSDAFADRGHARHSGAAASMKIAAGAG